MNLELSYSPDDWPFSVSVSLLPGLIAYGMGEQLSKADAFSRYWPQIKQDAKTGKLAIRTGLGSKATSNNFVFEGSILMSGYVRLDVLKRYMWHRHRIKVSTDEYTTNVVNTRKD